MTALSITYPSFTAGTTIVSAQVNQNNTDIVNYVNARNGATANWDAVSTVGAFTSTLTSAQIILGTTRTVTISAGTPASSSRIWTIPDISSAGTFAALEGTQTFSGAKTFSTASTFQYAVSSASDGNLQVYDTTAIAAGVGGQINFGGIYTGSTTTQFGRIKGSKTNLTAGNLDTQLILGARSASNGFVDIITCDGNTNSALVHGTNTNDSAAAGNVGEYISTTQTSAQNFPTSTQYGDLVSISLTAGDWDITAVANMDGNGSSGLGAVIGISTTSGNSSTGLTTGNNLFAIGSTNGAVGTASIAIPGYRVSLSTTTIHYLKFSANYTGGPPKLTGRISGRRVR